MIKRKAHTPIIERLAKKSCLFLACLSVAVPMSAQHTRQGLMQPKYEDFNLKFWVRQMTVVQRYATGMDINFQETYLFDSVGDLAEYRKRGFGGLNITKYPLPQLDPQKRYDFDYDGDILRVMEFDMKGRLASSTHYIYGSGGNLVQTVSYAYNEADSGVVMERTVTQFDKKERPVSIETYTSDELLLVAEKIKYDRRGNDIQRRITYYEEESTTVNIEKRSYTYDRRGNWTSCRYSLDGKEIYTINRKIEYYGE
ncbi:MAG: hypothetical protein J6T88_09530 [Bacteroidales bacterium]|nr:hypothetical protein [Bacteroidales bacterium]